MKCQVSYFLSQYQIELVIDVDDFGKLAFATLAT